MTFTITTWQQALATASFFFVAAFSWHFGTWCAGWCSGRLTKK